MASKKKNKSHNQNKSTTASKMDGGVSLSKSEDNPSGDHDDHDDSSSDANSSLKQKIQKHNSNEPAIDKHRSQIDQQLSQLDHQDDFNESSKARTITRPQMPEEASNNGNDRAENFPGTISKRVEYEDRTRSNSPQKSQYVSRQQDPGPYSTDGETNGAILDPQRQKFQGPSSKTEQYRSQEQMAVAYSEQQTAHAKAQPAYKGDRYEYRERHGPSCSCHQTAVTHSSHSHRPSNKQVEQQTSSTHTGKYHQTTSRPKPEPKDPTTLRVQGYAERYLQAIKDAANTRGDWESYFFAFAEKMLMEIKQSEDRLDALTKEMLAGRDRYQPTTDGEFQGLMNQLREHVKNLTRDIINGLRLQEQEFWGVLEGNLLTNQVHGISWGGNRNRRCLVESAVWQLLRDHVFLNPFQEYGHEGQELGSCWSVLFYNGPDQNQVKVSTPPQMSELSEKWKSLTGTRLHEKYGTTAPGSDEVKRSVLEKLVDPLSAGNLGKAYSPQSGWGRNLELVVDCAANLAMIMSKQRSRIELYVPEVSLLDGTNVHALGKIVDIEEEDGAPIQGKIDFVVIPGLRRWGDGLGTNLDRHVDLEAARVKCK